MKRVVLTLIAVLVTAVGLLWPVIANAGSGSTDAGVDPVVITDYAADLTLADNGRLTATETLTTEFPGWDKHGIFRFWDVADAADAEVRYVPQDISVTMDGQSVPFEMSSEQGGRFKVAKIGDPDSTVSAGTHTYRISYRVDGTIRDGNPGSFIWRVIPNGWKMQILKSTSTIRFPAAPTSFECRVNDGSPCTVGEPDASTRTVTTGALSPTTGVAVKAGLPFAGPGQDRRPWGVSMDPVLGSSPAVPITAVIISLLTLGAGLFWTRRSREDTPLLPVMFEPPADPQSPKRFLGPAATHFVIHEAMPKKALIATLFHLAEQGHIGLERASSTDWTITARMSASEYAALDGPSAVVMSALGLTARGATFAADGSTEAGEKLKGATDQLTKTTKSWALTTGVLRRSPFEIIGRVVVGVAFVIGALLMALGFVPTIVGLPFAAFMIGGVGLLLAGVGTRRTRLGRQVWSRAGGFERLLSTPSNQDRLDFSAREDLYTSFIPYAIAFDCADAWAAKYRYTTGQEPPDPVWLPGLYYGAGAHGLMSGGTSGLDSFESSLSSSLSAYSASQSSSSGGGGFGGSFSGGGGGSW
ncbi:DUF2207 domain-containing protein [Gordonia phthalatica]|uniref:DUF2207 domain-containing protein n=1 Tax=Gordonia phthalatica TaxID=1136941 RepID=A0A0N9N878_9ACTN|nr:DUF2207 domain-containing protein [Gordonia phthalatica]ALG83316.1 hypothetical protein ACH46_00830 [Gordonia phthalatica]